MTEAEDKERIEKLARAAFPGEDEDGNPDWKYWLAECEQMLAAIDADPEVYGYRKAQQVKVLHHRRDSDGYCFTHEAFDDPT